MRRSALLVIIVGLAFLVLPAGLATATAPTQVAIQGATCPGGCEAQNIGPIFGTITCTAAQEFFLRANIRQFGQTVAVGRASGTCTGSQQSWSTSRTDNPRALDCGSSFTFGGSGTAGGTEFHIPQTAGFCS
jgi:hypothetical protein